MRGRRRSSCDPGGHLMAVSLGFRSPFFLYHPFRTSSSSLCPVIIPRRSSFFLFMCVCVSSCIRCWVSGWHFVTLRFTERNRRRVFCHPCSLLFFVHRAPSLSPISVQFPPLCTLRWIQQHPFFSATDRNRWWWLLWLAKIYLWILVLVR